MAIGLRELFQQVEHNLCCHCGTCYAACSYDAISWVDDVGPRPLQACRDCGACFTACPKNFLPMTDMQEAVFGPHRAGVDVKDPVIGRYREVQTIRQGDILALARHALETGVVRAWVGIGQELNRLGNRFGILVDRPDELEKIDALNAHRPNELIGFDDVTPALTEAVDLYGLDRVGLIGPPCVTEAWRKLQYMPDKKFEKKIGLIIGHYCFGVLREGALGRMLKDQMGVSADEVSHIGHGLDSTLFYRVETKSGRSKTMPASIVSHYAPDACLTCVDPTAELADISFGRLGAGAGRFSVVLRSEAGQRLFRSAADGGLVKDAQRVPMSGKPMDSTDLTLKALGWGVKAVTRLPVISAEQELQVAVLFKKERGAEREKALKASGQPVVIRS
jgi:coenzyme F420 hydrogenase subunit beta